MDKIIKEDAESPDHKWCAPERYAFLSVEASLAANVFRFTDKGSGASIIVDGFSLADYIRQRVAAVFCPRCGDCTRGALLTTDLHCETCEAFDRARL